MDKRSGITISDRSIKTYSKNFNSKKYSRAIMNAVSKSGINAVAFNNEVQARMRYRFSLEIETMGATDQKQSGRCWLFAGLNVLRERIAGKIGVESFELSQNHIAFWDKLEKANYFLECIIDTLDEKTDSRIVTWLLQYPITDGGQWDMFVNLVDKYGVVPKDAMPETFHSSQTRTMNALISTKLREYSLKMRTMHEGGEPPEMIRKYKNDILGEIYTLLCVFFGEPPADFDFEYNDKDKKFFRDEGLTAKRFAEKYIDMDIHEYVSVINATTVDKPFDRAFTVKYLGNVKGGRDILYLNTDIGTLKALVIDQMKGGEPVWFGSDMGKMTDRESGIMDAELYRYDTALDMEFSLTKAQRLDYRESCMNHAMVLTGVNLVGDSPNRWKVENSWGEKNGEKGYFVMSDQWFDEYLYQVVVHRKHLPEHLRSAFDKPVIILEPWDPMGSLA